MLGISTKQVALKDHPWFSYFYKEKEKKKTEIESSSGEKDEDQIVPRLITIDEKAKLLNWIKENKAKEIVDFFNTNSVIDYPLIRFKDNEVNGYTPLAAAVHYCKIDTVKVLMKAQYQQRAQWTVDLAPGFGLAEIAAKQCPELFIKLVKSVKRNEKGILSSSHPLAPLIEDLNHLQLATIMRNIKAYKYEELVIVLDWMKEIFNQKESDLLKDKPIYKRQDTSAITMKFQMFFEAALKLGADPNVLVFFLVKQVRTVSESLFRYAAVHMLRSGLVAEYMSIYRAVTTKNGEEDRILAAALSVLALPYLTPSQIKLLQLSDSDELRKTLSVMSLQDRSEQLLQLVNSASDAIQKSVRKFFDDKKKQKQTIDHSTLFEDTFNANKIQFFIKLQLPRIFSFFLKKYPRVDSAVELSRKDLKKPQDMRISKVYSTGSEEAIESTKINEFFIKDDDKGLAEYIKTLPADVQIRDLRFDFAPYRLSFLKTAVMLKKLKLVKLFVTSEDDKIRQSLYASTKFQLNALEMAACYHPEFLVANILPLVGTKCSQRLKMANFVIEMFGETKFQKCPTGAANAPLVIPHIMNSKVPEEIECINVKGKDAIEEAVKLKYPIEIIKAFYMTGHYNNIKHYINLAIQRGSLDLFKYFTKILNETGGSSAKSPEVRQALARWVRYTNGNMNEENISMLEELLAHPDVNVNAYDPAGMTALSIATQRSLVWIMKRLLLDKNINVNLVDIASSTPIVQHSLNIFRNDQKELDFSGEHVVIRMIVQFLKEMDIIEIDEGLVQTIKENLPIDIFDKKFFTFNPDGVFQTWKASVPTRLNDFLTTCGIDIFGMTNAKYFLRRVSNASLAQLVPVIVDLVEEIRKIIGKLERNTAFMTVAGHHIPTAKTFVEMTQNVIDEIFAYARKISVADTIKALGKLSAEYGLPHNVLLAHPDINTALENKSNLDALYLSKYRSMDLKGDDEGFDEMARTHLRIKNNFALYENVKKNKAMIFNVISAIIVGAASVGVIRWMI